jgi:hypothetical protein
MTAEELEKQILKILNSNEYDGLTNEASAKEIASLFKQQYQKQLREELLAFNSWMCGKQYDGRIPLIGTCIDEYLKQKGLPL